MPPSPILRVRPRILLFTSICVTLVAFVLLPPSRQHTTAASDKGAVAHAGNTITVNITTDVVSSIDGLCTLREAIIAANTNTASGPIAGECMAGGSGSDTINFSISSMISLPAALPDITSDLTIDGPGANTLSIERITAGNTPNFRIFTIGSGTNVVISGLTIRNGNAGGSSFPTNSGGGILNSGTLTLVNSVISGNAATGSGGGIFVDQGTLNCNSSTITGNNAASGAGISNQGTTTINQTTVSGNTAVGSGGGISNSSGGNQSSVLTVNKSTVSNNSSQGGNGGGGIFNIGQAFASNSTISSNTAGSGGGISNANPMTLTNVTISGNTGTSVGGGIYNPGIGTLTFTNTIIAGNNSPSGPDGNGANFISQDYNLIGNTSGAQINGTTTHNIANVNALLGPLANNGGPTLTHSLLPGSPAIDAGNTSALITDQRGAGFNRVVDGNGDGNAAVDIGAYEVQSILVTNLNDSGAGSLRQAITDANANAGTDAINFQPGVMGTISLSIALPDLSTSMAINGPGASTLTVQRSTAGGTPNFRIFTVNSGTRAAISGVTILNGRVDSGGGGVANDGILNILNVTITANQTNDALPGDSGNPGGGIYNNGQLGVTNSIVAGNLTGKGSNGLPGGRGGGIYNLFPNTLTVVNSTVSGNRTGNGGSGASGGEGGGIFSQGPLEITNSTISNNQTGGGTAAGVGGGIYASNTLVLTNSTVSGNQTNNGANGDGGGIFSGTATLTNSTITNNSTGVSGRGGGIRGGGTTNLKNTIVANNNVGAGGAGPDLSGTFTSQDYNLIGNTSGAIVTGTIAHNITGLDPKLGPLANNGGSTMSHALLAGSPALDAGDDSVTGAPLNLSTDQRGTGFGRRIDGPDADTTATVDIGAFEAQVSLEDITDKATNEDTPLQFSFNLGGLGSITSVTASSSNTALVPNSPANLALTGSGSPRTLTINPVADQFGTSTITVTVNGTNSQSMTDTFVLTVNSVNDAPSFTKGSDQFVNNNTGGQRVDNWATNISTGPANESSQTVAFQVANNTNAGLFSVAPVISSAGTLTYTPVANASGLAAITIVLNDTGGTANGGVNTSPPQTFNITVNSTSGSLSFSSPTYGTTESSGSTTITVKRTGDMSRAVTVDYKTSGDTGVPCATPGAASPKCDFTSALGTLKFAIGEDTKTFTVLISQDSFVEGSEPFTITLSNPTGGGGVLAPPSTATVTIDDDLSEPTTNAIDDASNFVRQNYHDFLNREPDASGLAFWTNQITSCGSDQACIELRRINVSAAFFLSIEFQGTGYLVERLYKTSYGDVLAGSTFGGPHQLPVPIVRFNEFLPDTQEIGQGVIVGQTGWEAALENNKQAFVSAFVQRPRFTTALPTSLTPTQFVNTLFTNAGLPLSGVDYDQAIADFSGAGNTTNNSARASALRRVAENSTLQAQEFNRAFVLMEYFGYERRNPNDPQDTDYSGYDFWLTKLNQFNGNFVNAEMVKAFITSSEYRQHFGP